MADFAHTLATVDRVLDTDGLDRYRGQAEDMAADAVGSDPVLRAVTARITEPWEGTGAELLDQITSHDEKPPKAWPATARAMTGDLRRKAPVLRRLGWTVDDLGRGGKDKVLRWSIQPPEQAGMRRASGGHGGHEAGVSEDSCPPDAPPMTCEDGETSPEAGMAGMKPPSPLCCDSKKVEERAPGADIRVRSETSPAVPASPADPLDTAIDVATRLLGATPVGAR